MAYLKPNTRNPRSMSNDELIEGLRPIFELLGGRATRVESDILAEVRERFIRRLEQKSPYATH